VDNNIFYNYVKDLKKLTELKTLKEALCEL